ncbi:hypothetical protein QN399_00935 [Pseudomonas sp. 10C3]|uniref:STY1053 family phage-associated protein n=1 Tax=Pseudomonas sp. 10C3 TaxID=3118753 RepID=UPI002E81AC32|nr:hypothetical protein [Pseudomonas sp. 10C3]MEE3504840.1 hypothetical protein [Pseudomonas sp. 10C3]
MKFINVLEGFKLNLAEGVREIGAGIQEVEDEIAAHWFVVANSTPLTAKQAKARQPDEPAAEAVSESAVDPAAEQAATNEPATEPEPVS